MKRKETMRVARPENAIVIRRAAIALLPVVEDALLDESKHIRTTQGMGVEGGPQETIGQQGGPGHD